MDTADPQGEITLVSCGVLYQKEGLRWAQTDSPSMTGMSSLACSTHLWTAESYLIQSQGFPNFKMETIYLGRGKLPIPRYVHGKS